MFWLVFDADEGRVVVIQPGATLIFARVLAASQSQVVGKFVEGHRLDPKQVKRIPKSMIGKAITAKQAEALLRRLAK